LADIANGNTVLVGKRQLTEADQRFLAALGQLAQNIGQTIVTEVSTAANQLVQQGALAFTQVLADIANGNTVLVGKREITEADPRIWAALSQFGQTIGQIVVTEVSTAANPLVQQGALAVTQVLADIANGNTVLVGKRQLTEEDQRFLSSLVQLGQTIGQSIVTEVSNAANQLVQQGALAVTQVLADIANGNTVLVGKRDEIDTRIFNLISNAVNTVANQAYDLLNSAVQTVSFQIAVTLANIAENGLIGKRATF